jgi:hypothetical protein
LRFSLGTDIYDHHGGFVMTIIAATVVYALMLPVLAGARGTSPRRPMAGWRKLRSARSSIGDAAGRSGLTQVHPFRPTESIDGREGGKPPAHRARDTGVLRIIANRAQP